MARITEQQDHLLNVLREHGPSRLMDFSRADVQAMKDKGYVEDYANGPVALTERGLRYLRRSER